MKILFFLDSLTSGGKERRFTELAKSLNSNPTVDFLVVLMNDEIFYKEILDLKCELKFLVRSSKKDLSIFKKLFNICYTYKPDIIHCWDSMTAVYSIPVCKLLNIKLINGMVIDSPVNQSILNKYWLRAKVTFPFSNKIIGNSQAGLKAYGAPPSKSLCIYNGVSFCRFENLKNGREMRNEIFGNNSENIFVIGMVASFEARKDYMTLVKAAKEILPKYQNTRFLLIGGGRQLAEIKNMIPEDLQEKIVLTGKRSDVENLINILDIGVLLTNSKVHGEGISNSIIEYMALGKPVIATRGGGTNELISEGENGFLITPADKDQLVEKIEVLMKNKAKMIAFAENGKVLVRAKFNIAGMTQRFLAVYESLITSRK